MSCTKTAAVALSCILALAPREVLAKASPADAVAPAARVTPVELEKHGDVRVDNYFWLRERTNPEVIRYLEDENAYTDAMTAHTQPLQEVLYKEIVDRIKETDVSVPYKMDDYFYYDRFEAGKEYPIYCRKRGSLDAPEGIMLDVNAMAEGYEFFNVRGFKISSGQDIAAYPVDTAGRRIYTIHFKDLTSGETLPDVIPYVTGNMAWANDNKTLFYTKQDPVTLRPFRVYKHALGADPSKDELVYEETDDTFNCFVSKTKSKKYVLIGCDQTLSTEYRFLDADHPEGQFTVIQPRRRELEYHVDHYGDRFYIRTNLDARNFRLMSTSIDATGVENWVEVIPHRDDVLLEGMEIFRDYLVLEERVNGLVEIRVRPWAGGEEHYVDFDEPAYLAYATDNHDFDSRVLRYAYESMTTPESIYDYDMEARERTLLKREEVLGGFKPEDYRTERLWATAADGTKVPISIVYKVGLRREGGNPTLLHGYGSYGYSLDANFASDRLSLLDRGFVYAIAHVRGGQELGRSWYEDGKLLKKRNTFTDFVDCAEFLVEAGYTSPAELFISGGSAGGLLIGAVVNMRPDLFKGAIARVPWVDVVTTMLDDSIPLTTAEYDEWGNPNEKEYYDYMLSYSPYDNVEAKDYPNLLVTTSLQDSQVQYWEPAKWVAKLRAMKTDSNVLLLRTKMQAGHGGVSGRYKRYRETAFTYAFMLDLLGIEE
jgi:oligopeptidase B